jgi:hypothetical protein
MHMHLRGRRLTLAAVLALLGTTALVPSEAGAGSTAASGKLTATAITPTSTLTAPKSTSGKLAQSDPSLLGRTDSTRVNVMVKLDYDATASYTGDVAGYAATSPSVTGRKLTGKSDAERAYEGYTGRLDQQFRNALSRAVPSAKAGISLQRVYGGVAVQLPANDVSKVLSIPGVAAVQLDALNHPDTVESPQFIGAPTIWNQVGGQSLAGKGVIFGDLDTGIWPEHPMLTDNPALGNPPAAPSGNPRACDFGDNPLTPANDPFVCNHKVIGGQAFLATYNALQPPEVYTTARDSNGHGTHTTTTAAGDAVASAQIFGVERGPISGVAPGAWVIEYKVCGLNGCYTSDTAAAAEQAIADGVNVINFSISGGSNPFGDATELAFLDAYKAGVLVAASAGNSGPGAGTTDHHGPWLMTVAASTQSRQFQSTLTLTDGAASTQLVGTSITAGVSSPAPVVLAQNIPGYDVNCSTALPAGSVTGKIVACHRGVIGRVQKGFNVLQGGAVGMILYNDPLADTESDNHFLPAVHLASGTDFLAFMAAHPNATATFTAGVKADGQGDVMAAFSSRGPGGQFLKPDITAPGVQVLAGNTPTPDEVASGPPGQYYQAIAGTSMSSPHIAGSAILMKALHPTWSPGAIKSALMTTATTNVVKEDLVTPADPFDFGAGRVDLNVAGAAQIVFDDTADRMYDLGQDPVAALDLNLPSINVPTMPGTVTVHRTAKNLGNSTYRFTASAVAPAGSQIQISPRTGRIAPGGSQTFTVTITSSAPTGQYFGRINITGSSGPALHLPVAFYNQQGAVSLTQSCAASSLREGQSTTCTVTATNNAQAPATTSVVTQVNNKLRITSANGATVVNNRTAKAGPTVLAAPADAKPSIAPGSLFGFLPLADFGIGATPIGDEQALNFSVDPFLYGGVSYSTVGVVSDGYIVVGGATSASDIQYLPQTLPDPAQPNNVLAPYWTDLEGGAHAGVYAGELTDGVNTWIVVEWDVQVFGVSAASGERRMQVWIGVDGTEDITYTYDTASLVSAPGQPLTVGAESPHGTEGAQIPDAAPQGDYRITTSPGAPGGSLSYGVTVRALDGGTGTVTSNMTADIVPGTTVVSSSIRIR